MAVSTVELQIDQHAIVILVATTFPLVRHGDVGLL